MKLLFASVFFCFLTSWQALAQPPFSYPLDSEKIPSKEVYRILQVNQGYIWLGCNAGLFRYNGADFKQYQNAELSGRAISNLELDSMGRLWCGTFMGQILFVENDSLKLFENWSENEKQFPVFKPRTNGLWLTSDKGLHKVTFEHEQFAYALPEQAHPHTENIHIDCNGQLLVYSALNGFYREFISTPRHYGPPLLEHGVRRILLRNDKRSEFTMENIFRQFQHERFEFSFYADETNGSKRRIVIGISMMLVFMFQ